MMHYYLVDFSAFGEWNIVENDNELGSAEISNRKWFVLLLGLLRSNIMWAAVCLSPESKELTGYEIFQVHIYTHF